MKFFLTEARLRLSRSYPRARWLLSLLALVSLLGAGCGGTADCPASGRGLGSTCGQGSSSNSNGSGSTGTGLLYVLEGNNLRRFAGATTIDGNVLPAAIIRGSATRLSTATGAFLDTASDRVYIPNAGDSSVLVFDNLSTLSENVPPPRVLSGASTRLSAPLFATFDTSRNELYVVNGSGGLVLVFANASSVQGSVAPSRFIGGAVSGLDGTRSILLDINNDRMYAANAGSNSILVFDNISTRSGDPPPVRRITGPNTRLNQPHYLLLDSSGRLYVSCAGSGEILRFDSASSAEGNTAPSIFIGGAGTLLDRPGQMVLDNSGNLMVTTTTAVLVFNNIASATGGSPAPNRRLTGGNTGITDPTGLMLDLTR